jgi:Uma2 family endonuclease
MFTADVPITKPATERIADRLWQKLSPQMPHGVLQRRIAGLLGAWADQMNCGLVATEWEFHLRQPDGSVDVLVPDIAYLSYERAGVGGIEDIPRVPPDLAVEIRSPDESAKRRQFKVERYLAAGTPLVLDVDPERETITIFRPDRAPETVAKEGRMTHEHLPGFALEGASVFAPIRRR